MTWLLLAAATASASQLRSTHHELLGLMAPHDPLRTTILDFSLFHDEFDTTKTRYLNSLDTQIGLHPFRCYFPPRKLGHSAKTCPTEGTNVTANAGADAPAGQLTWLTPAADDFMRSERRNHLTLSKITAMLGRCFTYKRQQDDIWSFSLCVGREVVRYKGVRIMARSGSELLHMGHHDPELDEVFLNGTMIQYYTDGMANESSSIKFTCSAAPVRVTHFDEVTSQFTIEGPQFCDWRSSASVAARPTLDRLLMEEVGSCFNLTADYWTYEYCHPDSLTQFHLEKDDTIRTPLFLMGGLKQRQQSFMEAADPLEIGLPAPSPTFPFVRSASAWVKSPETLAALRERFLHLPLEIVKVPLSLLAGGSGQLWPREAGAKGLALYLDEGSSCPEMPQGVRTTRVIFICPQDMAEHRGFRLLTVRESRTCQYDLLIESPHVCAHPSLRPPMSELPDTIRCFRRRNDLTAAETSSLGDLSLSPRAVNATQRFMARMIGIENTPNASLLEKRQMTREAKGQLVSELNWLPVASAVAEAAQSTESSSVKAAVYGSGRVSKIQLVEHLPLVQGEQAETFGMSGRPRQRAARFRVGDVVQQTLFNYTGVVSGWDGTARVTEDWFLWVAGMYRLRSEREKRQMLRGAWFLLEVPPPTVVDGVDYLQTWTSQAYVPEILLRRATQSEASDLIAKVDLGWRPAGFSSYTRLDDALRFIAHPTAVSRDRYPFDQIPEIVG